MAAKYDDRTARGWPLPHQANRLYDDVERLREALTLIDEALSGIDTHEGIIEDRQDSLSTRLDTILEGATEDSEILDARVDAKDQVHPNLGHNIRNLHRLLLHADDDIRYQAEEFAGLLRQYGELVRAQIRGELNAIEAHERRKFEIQQEALSRYQGDTSLQSQVDLLAENDIENALTRKIERETSRAEHNRERNAREQADNAEISQRVEFDDVLQAQINQLANSILQSTINFRNSLERRKNEIRQEILTRSQNDEDLHSRLDENLAMCGMLQSQVDALVSAVFQINSSLDGITDNAHANLQNAITIAREINTRREALKQEVLTRNKQDAGILEQINQLAYSVLRLTVQQDETSRRVSEVEIEKASAPGQVATDSEFDEMLDELYDKP